VGGQAGKGEFQETPTIQGLGKRGAINGLRRISGNRLGNHQKELGKQKVLRLTNVTAVLKKN